MLQSYSCAGMAMFLVAALCSSHASADSFRCGANLIREQMPGSEIVAKCGDPDSVTKVTEPVMARRANGSSYQVGETTIETWTYDRGAGRFPARITVEEGIATRIELLSRQ